VTGAIGLVVVAVAPGLGLIYAGLFFAGVSSAFANPATNLALLPLPNRGPLVGIKLSGVQISALVSGVGLTPLAGLLGWRDALLVFAGVSLIGLLLIWWAGPVPDVVADEARDRSGVVSSIAGLALFAFLMGCGLAATTSYLPLYATEDLDLSPHVGGLLLGIFGVCAVVGRITWGFLTQRWGRFARPPVALGAMAAGALVAAGLLGLAGAGLPALVYGGAALMGLTGAAWNGLLMTFVMDSAEASVSGRASGRVQSAFFGGLCLSPLIFGVVSDRTGSFAYVWVGTVVIYGLALLTARTRLSVRSAHRDQALTASLPLS
jgi:predicted MFS family arabinose efflux permease